MEYRTIFIIKESEKATVELADLEGMKVPVVVKRLQGASPNIYRLLCYAQNPHIPQVFACEQHGNELIVAEEYADGENLREYLEKGALSDDAKLDLALQLCEAVEFLHSMEPAVIHRDIKPSNILITGKGILKLIDFDASRQYKDAQNDEDTRLLGTRGYAAPEQFGYSQTDVRSDIYSMGIVFHEMKPADDKKKLIDKFNKEYEGKMGPAWDHKFALMELPMFLLFLAIMLIFVAIIFWIGRVIVFWLLKAFKFKTIIWLVASGCFSLSAVIEGIRSDEFTYTLREVSKLNFKAYRKGKKYIEMRNELESTNII